MLLVSLIIILIIFFVVLIFVLRRLLEKNVSTATRHLESMAEDYIRKEEEIRRKLNDAELEARKIVDRAQSEAEETKTQIIREAQAYKDKILQEAQAQSEEIIQKAENSRKLLIAEMEEKINQEAIKKSVELIEKALPSKICEDLHDHWLEELINSGFEGLGNLNLSEEVEEVEVISAFPLKERQRQGLLNIIEGRIGRKFSLKEEINPQVIAGVIIRIGSLVLDGSLKNRFLEAAKNVYKGST